jgi:hypothetical protein
MDNSFQRQGSDTQQRGFLATSLRIFDGFLDWLAGLVELTEEEQEDAGIYLGRTGRE